MVNSALAFQRPEVLDRYLDREAHSNFKVVCECGVTEFINRASMTECVDEYQYWHARHKKTIYHKSGSTNEFRGILPSMYSQEIKKVA